MCVQEDGLSPLRFGDGSLADLLPDIDEHHPQHDNDMNLPAGATGTGGRLFGTEPFTGMATSQFPLLEESLAATQLEPKTSITRNTMLMIRQGLTEHDTCRCMFTCNQICFVAQFTNILHMLSSYLVQWYLHSV